MSDSFQRFYRRASNPFDEEDDDGSYRPWDGCQQGDAINLKFVPARGASRYVWQVPYLQPMTIRYDRDTEQLCLLCHSTGTTVILEGRGLDQLADLIGEKRVRAVYQFDADHYPQPSNDLPVITAMTVEERG